MMKNTPEEIGMLRLVELYGDGLSVTGPHFRTEIRSVAKALIGAGLLSGSTKNLRLTDIGKQILAAQP